MYSDQKKKPKAYAAQRKAARASEMHRREQLERSEHEQYWDDRVRRTIDGGRVIRKQLGD